MRLPERLLLILIATVPLGSYAQTQSPTEAPESEEYAPTPQRPSGEGDGPFEKLIIRGATVIDGTGAPPFGPADIVIEGARIKDVVRVGSPLQTFPNDKRPQGAAREIDASGQYVMPGLVDLHTHVVAAADKRGPSQYAYKLWLGHGITTIRGVPLGPLEWSLAEKTRSAANQITAPRIVVYQTPGDGKEWKGRQIVTPDDARAWVRYAKKQGVDGIKVLDRSRFSPQILGAIWDEAKRQNMGSTAHLGQLIVAETNARDAARLGLGGMTHFYGLFESLYKDHDVQPWPPQHNYGDEQDRFASVADQWKLVHERGSKEWKGLIHELRERDFYINPTMTIYSANRDLMRAMNADWHKEYTLPSIAKFYEASKETHGSYWYHWTTEKEVAWRKFYQVWMSFLNDYKNAGGKVTLGSDSGFIYQLYGFGTILELEMLQEAGFTPLEVARAATMHSAMELARASGGSIDRGVLRAGALADLIVLEENPLENFKTLYGTGAPKFNAEKNAVERVGGVKLTIKDGVVYDAKKLLQDVRQMVQDAKAKQ
jgi:imidazolonepropionase-like amidohydrolase